MREKLNLKIVGSKLFKLGIFFIPSAVALSGIFFLISSIIGIKERKNIHKDFWNIPIFIFSFSLIFICIIQNLINKEIDNSLTWIGLLNWLPLFLLFLGNQTYLETWKDRKNASIYLVAGSLPVIITGFGQYFFNWHGPFEFLNGLIVWFQRPIDFNENRGLTGLFSNQNYAGSWFSIIWPFCVSFLIEKTNNIYKKGFSVFFFLTVLISLILTFSRNAYGGLVISIPPLVGSTSLYWLLPIIILILILPSSDFILNRININTSYTLKTLIYKIGSINNLFDDSRFEIWNNSLKLILQKPLIGWGAGLYPIVYSSNFNEIANHSHNIFLEVAFNYGVFIALLKFLFIVSITFLSMKIVFFQKEEKDTERTTINYSDRAWWTSFLVLFLSQMADVQYYDGKISIIFWILLAGLKNIIKN